MHLGSLCCADIHVHAWHVLTHDCITTFCHHHYFLSCNCKSSGDYETAITSKHYILIQYLPCMYAHNLSSFCATLITNLGLNDPNSLSYLMTIQVANKEGSPVRQDESIPSITTHARTLRRGTISTQGLEQPQFWHAWHPSKKCKTHVCFHMYKKCWLFCIYVL